MPGRIWTYVLSPRRWMLAGVACWGLSALVGYHHDQVAASLVLAQKVELPPEVMIQDFDGKLHSNILNELQILAEIDVAHAERMNTGNAERPHWVHVVPVFAVSAGSRPFAMQRLKSGQLRRPVPRHASEKIGIAARQMRSYVDRPMAAMIVATDSVSTPTLEQLGLTPITEGDSGMLVAISAASLAPSSTVDDALGMLEHDGLVPTQSAFGIAHRVDARSPAAGLGKMSRIVDLLTWMAVFLVGGALAMLLTLRSGWDRRGRARPAVVETVSAFTPAFRKGSGLNNS